MNRKGRAPYAPPQYVVVCKHPERKKKARGLCNSCYNIWQYKTSEKAHQRFLRMGKVYYRRRKERDPGFVRRQQIRKHGLTPEQYNAMLAAQNGVCAICGKPETSKPNLAIDHDHDTNKVRGLLCMICNTGIGKLPTKEMLQKAISYLEASA